MTDIQAITVRLPRDIYEELRAVAYETRLSMNEIAVSGVHRQVRAVTLSDTERRVWNAWNAIPEGAPAPVKQISRFLGMTPADVAFIVYPAEAFGPWDDSQEPDLP